MYHNETKYSATGMEDQKVLNSLGLRYVVLIVDELWGTKTVVICQSIHHVDDCGPDRIYGPNENENPELIRISIEPEQGSTNITKSHLE